MQITDTTPVIIAAGQVVDRLGEGWRRLSPADLAAEAVRTTLDGTGIDDLASQVDQLMVMRTFVDSVPDRIKPLLAPLAAAISLRDRLQIGAVCGTPKRYTQQPAGRVLSSM